MPTFRAPDGTLLAYHVLGLDSPAPVVCLPGGPMQASVYLGDLGGLSAHRQLVLLDLRGTGDSGEPEDPGTYRYDRQVGDVEALREHLGLERLELLGHSGGTSLAVAYAAEHPQRIARLALIAPSPRPVGLETTAEARRRVLARRTAERWFPAVSAALGRIAAGTATGADWEAIAPALYGRWDTAARAHHAAEATQRNEEAAGVFYSGGASDPADVRARLAGLAAPVLLLAGELDLAVDADVTAEFAALFRDAHLVVQAGAGHFPWMDDAAAFVASVSSFLR